MNRYLCGYDESEQVMRIHRMSDLVPTRRDIEYGALYIHDNEYRNGHNWRMWLYADSIGEATKKFLEVMRL